MAEKFLTKRYDTKIQSVEIERESESCVWIKSSGFSGERMNRAAKKTYYEEYHDSWEAAHIHLLSRSQGVVDSLKEQLHKARTELGQIESMKKPDAVTA